MPEVEVTDLGGDKVLVCFPSKEYLDRFFHCNYDWVRLWFQSLNQWQEGDRANHHCCWIEIRGLPLNAWCQEFFEHIGSHFGRLVRVHHETKQRKHLGPARLEVLTSQGGLISKSLTVGVMGQMYVVLVLEIAGDPVARERSSIMEDESRDGSFGGIPVIGDDRTLNMEDEINHTESLGSAGDPFNLMPIIMEDPVKGQSVAQFGASGAGEKANEFDYPPSKSILNEGNSHLNNPCDGPLQHF
ncbi:hypothetical protein Tsubulata_049970, partial [Turnera subulata]